MFSQQKLVEQLIYTNGELYNRFFINIKKKDRNQYANIENIRNYCVKNAFFWHYAIYYTICLVIEIAYLFSRTTRITD